jgi:hypothetical protein
VLDVVIICSCQRRFWYLVTNDNGLHIRCSGCQQRLPIEIKERGEEGALTESALDYGLRASRQPLPENGLPPYTIRPPNWSRD